MTTAAPASGHGSGSWRTRAYFHPSTREQLRQRKFGHTIPQRSDQIARRKAKGSHDGRPPGFDPDAYKKRNTVERGYSRIKQWRGIAIRYDKHARTFLGGVLLAASAIYAKTRRSKEARSIPVDGPHVPGNHQISQVSCWTSTVSSERGDNLWHLGCINALSENADTKEVDQ